MVVLLDGDEARLIADPEAEPLATIDPTRRFARVSGDGEPLEAGAAARGRAGISAEVVGVCQRALEMTPRVRQGPQAVRGRGRLLPGRRAPLRPDAAAHRERALDGLLRRLGGRCRAGAARRRPRRWRPRRRPTGGREVAASAIQAHGGIGFTWEADVHWLYKRAQLDAALLGGAGRHHAALARAAAARLGAPA